MTNAPQQVFVTYQPRPSTNGLAVAGMVIGIVALVIALIPLIGWFMAFVPAVLAVIFGHIGQSTAKRLGGMRRTESIVAWVTGYAALVLPGVITVFLVIISEVSGGSSS